MNRDSSSPHRGITHLGKWQLRSYHGILIFYYILLDYPIQEMCC